MGQRKRTTIAMWLWKKKKKIGWRRAKSRKKNVISIFRLYRWGSRIRATCRICCFWMDVRLCVSRGTRDSEPGWSIGGMWFVFLIAHEMAGCERTMDSKQRPATLSTTAFYFLASLPFATKVIWSGTNCTPIDFESKTYPILTFTSITLALSSSFRTLSHAREFN